MHPMKPNKIKQAAAIRPPLPTRRDTNSHTSLFLCALLFWFAGAHHVHWCACGHAAPRAAVGRQAGVQRNADQAGSDVCAQL
jgi:hypothetical protein